MARPGGHRGREPARAARVLPGPAHRGEPVRIGGEAPPLVGLTHRTGVREERRGSPRRAAPPGPRGRRRVTVGVSVRGLSAAPRRAAPVARRPVPVVRARGAAGRGRVAARGPVAETRTGLRVGRRDRPVEPIIGLRVGGLPGRRRRNPDVEQEAGTRTVDAAPAHVRTTGRDLEDLLARARPARVGRRCVPTHVAGLRTARRPRPLEGPGSVPPHAAGPGSDPHLAAGPGSERHAGGHRLKEDHLLAEERPRLAGHP